MSLAKPLACIEKKSPRSHARMIHVRVLENIFCLIFARQTTTSCAPHVSESTHLATAASTSIERLLRTLKLLWNFTTSDLCLDLGAAFVCNSRSTFAIEPFALTNAPRTPHSNGSGNARRNVSECCTFLRLGPDSQMFTSISHQRPWV